MAKLQLMNQSFSDTLIPMAYINNAYISLNSIASSQVSENSPVQIKLELITYAPEGVLSNGLLNCGVYLLYQQEMIDNVLKGKSFYEKTFKTLITTEKSYIDKFRSSTITTTNKYEEKNLFLKKNNIQGPSFNSYQANQIFFRNPSMDVPEINEKAYSAEIMLDSNVNTYNLHAIVFFYLSDNNVNYVLSKNKIPPVGDVILGPINMEKLTNTSEIAGLNITNLLANNVERFLLVNTQETTGTPNTAGIPAPALNAAKQEVLNVWAGPYHVHKDKKNSTGKPNIMAGLLHNQQAHPVLDKLQINSGIKKIFFVESFEIVEDHIKNVNELLGPPLYNGVKDIGSPISTISLSANENISNAIKGLLEKASYTPYERVFELPRSNRSSLVTTVGNFTSKYGLSAGIAYAGPSANTTNVQIQPSVFGASSGVSQTSIDMQKLGGRGFTFEVNKNQPIKNASEVYYSLFDNGNIGTMFAIDKINILKNFSGFARIIDFLPTKMIAKILAKTNLTKISVSRKAEQVNNLIAETVLDASFGEQSNPPKIKTYQVDRFFKSKDKNNSCIFEIHDNINIENKERITFLSLVDFRKDSTLKDKIRYEYDLEFRDGLELFLVEKFNRLNKHLDGMKRFRDFLELKSTNNLLKGRTPVKYDLSFFSSLEKSKQLKMFGVSDTEGSRNYTPTYFLQERINLLIGSYLDLISLLLPENLRNLELANQELQRSLNIYNGSLANLSEYINKFDKLSKLIRSKIKNEFTSLEDSERDVSRKSLKNKKNNFSFTVHSKPIELIKEGNNPVGYIEQLSGLGSDAFPVLDKTAGISILTNAESSVVTPAYYTPDYNKFIFDSKKSYENIVLLANQKNNVANFGIKKDYIITDDTYSKQELEVRDRILECLSSYGVKITTIDEEQHAGETTGEDVRKSSITPVLLSTSQVLGETNLFNVVPSDADANKQKQITLEFIAKDNNKTLDFNEDIGYIAANIAIGEIPNRNKNRISELNISEYTINNCLNAKIQYLSAYDITLDNVNLFRERWVSTSQNSSLLSAEQGNKLCRIQDFDNNEIGINVRKKLEVLKLYQTFILGNQKGSYEVYQSSISAPPGATQRNIEFSFYEDEVINILNGFEGLLQGARQYIHINKIFSHNYLIEQPISVKVFGTDFNKASKMSNLRTRNNMPSVPSATTTIQNTTNTSPATAGTTAVRGATSGISNSMASQILQTRNNQTNGSSGGSRGY